MLTVMSSVLIPILQGKMRSPVEFLLDLSVSVVAGSVEYFSVPQWYCGTPKCK